MEKLAQARRALSSLHAILREPDTVIVRDAAIQRFEYTSEAVWKAVREWLFANESIEANHPRACYRSLYSLGIIDEELSIKLLASIEDRNRTSHTYIETLAIEVYSRIPDHSRTFTAVLASIAGDEASQKTKHL